MATVQWVGNAQNTAQVDSLTVGGTPAAGNTISATISAKSVTYTLVSGDTTATAAAGLLALLQNTTSTPPEFQEITWSIDSASASRILGTAATAGTPFTLSASATGGGASLTQASVTANSSQSDVDNPANWLRAGVAGLPQNGDGVVLKDSSIPLLWNLDSLASVQFASFTRWQSQTGQVGLPTQNQGGYLEYRPTYFQFTSSGVGSLPVVLGQGLGTGSGPPLERYNVGTVQVNLTVLGSGSASDTYAIRFLGTHASNTFKLCNASVGVAMIPGEAATFASGTIDGGGSVDFGSGCTFSGTLTVNSGTANLYCAPGTISAVNGASVNVYSTGLTYATVTAAGGSTVSWLSDSTITTLTLTTGSVLDHSADSRAFTITNSTTDGDSCSIIDPNNVIIYTNGTVVKNGITSGPFTFQGQRTVKLT